MGWTGFRRAAPGIEDSVHLDATRAACAEDGVPLIIEQVPESKM